MIKNMGTTDRVIRLILAATFTTLYFTDMVGGTIGIILLVLAVIFALTSFISFCPLYWPFGIKTCKSESKSTNE